MSLFSSYSCSYELQSSHHCLVELLVVQELILCVFAVDKAQAKVTRVYVGSLMTSMEMAGVSLTLLVSSDSWEKYLGEETHLSP